MKKVFKCPHCSFWASTASRFHVHIVGHLNKKPFECSLCAYRSNWRWDITKHIRLKLLRDPQHSEAKVLMNDETGRRNYSKYNKYITLMRVVDKKHDGKLSKSGLVSLNYSPKSSLVQESNVQSPPSSASTPLSVYSDPPLNLQSSASSPLNVSSMLLEHLSKDMNFLKNLQNFNIVAHAFNSQNILQQHQQQQPQTQQQQTEPQEQEKSKEAENAKKTHFKCKKCNFKHADREVVLEHVKTHYRDDGTPQEKPSNTGMELAAPPPPLPIQMPFQIMNNLLNGHAGTTTSTNVHNRNLLTIGGGVNQIQPSNTNASTSHQTLNFSSQNTLSVIPTSSSSTSSHDAGKNNNGMPETTSTNSSSLKGSFRCGHCGQISNWKHVIQRHCRLKHNGDIRIEIAGQKNEKGNRPNSNQHHFMQATTSTSTMINQMPTTALTPSSTTIDKGFKPIILPPRIPPALILNPNITTIISPSTSETNPQLVDNQNKEISLDSMLKVEINSGEDQDKLETEIPANTIFVQPQGGLLSNEASSLINLNQQFGQKTKRYKCEMCPYETDSKSQFQYHSSFHKPSRNESYQCKYCSYNVSKRHLLNQHMKMHTACGSSAGGMSDDLNEAPIGTSNVEQGSQEILTNANERYMHFCPKCPGRYLSLKEIINHLKRHEVTANHRCDYCTFSSSDDSDVKAHSAVHTSYYQEKTKEFMAKYKQASDYPSPQLYTAKQALDDSGANDDVWVVKKHTTEQQQQQQQKNREQENTSDENKIDEKCLYCPFQATSLEVLKNHLQFHYAISGQYRPHKCKYCDFSCDQMERLREHNQLHFSLLLKGSKSLDIFTSFRGLELNISKINPNSNDANNNVNGENLIFKEKDVTIDESENVNKEKIIIDV